MIQIISTSDFIELFVFMGILIILLFIFLSVMIIAVYFDRKREYENLVQQKKVVRFNKKFLIPLIEVLVKNQEGNLVWKDLNNLGNNYIMDNFVVKENQLSLIKIKSEKRRLKKENEII